MIGASSTALATCWPRVEGALMTFSPDPRRRPEAQAVVGKIRGRKFEPEGYTLNSYAAIQAWKRYIEKDGSSQWAEEASHQLIQLGGR